MKNVDLIDPDIENESKFHWDLEFQRSIISMLILNRDFLLQALDLVSPGYFTNKVHSKVCEKLFKYYTKYKMFPTKTILTQEIKDDLKEDKALPVYLLELNTLFDYYEPGLETREYLLDKITFFAKIQKLRTTFSKSLQLLDKNVESEENWTKIYDMLREAMTVERNFDMGLDYFESYESRYERMKEEVEKADAFSTSFESVDAKIKGGGLIRGEIGSFMADSGVGKSRALACVAVENIKRDKKVLYVSFELDQDRLASRFDAIISDSPINCLLQEEIYAKVFEDLNFWQKEERKLIIKQFPAGSGDVNTLRAYLSQLQFHGFSPDLLIVDYVGEMKQFPGIPTHESMERIIRDLRGLAIEADICCFTAMQSTRNSKETQETGVIDRDNLAGSYGQIRPLDALWSLNQNKTEKQAFVGRLHAIKHREGEDGFTIFLKFDPKTLKIYEITYKQYAMELSKIKEKTNDKVVDGTGLVPEVDPDSL